MDRLIFNLFRLNLFYMFKTHICRQLKYLIDILIWSYKTTYYFFCTFAIDFGIDTITIVPIKGNPVKFRNSTRCCKLQFNVLNNTFATEYSGRRSLTGVSQKTCHFQLLCFLLSGLIAKRVWTHPCVHILYFLSLVVFPCFDVFKSVNMKSYV